MYDAQASLAGSVEYVVVLKQIELRILTVVIRLNLDQVPLPLLAHLRQNIDSLNGYLRKALSYRYGFTIAKECQTPDQI